MHQRGIRLGDVVDDYCPRCRLLMNHGVVGMVGEEIRKVRCNTCLSEHVFRHGRIPARRKGATSKLFEEVLKGMGESPGSPAATPVEAPAPPDDSGAADSREEAEPPPRPAPAQRKLYTIRRTTGGKGPARGPKG